MPAPLNRKRPKNLRHTFARLLSYMGMHKFLLAVVAVLVTVSALSNLLGTYMVKPLVNRYIVPGDIRGLIFGVAVTAAIYLTGALAAWGYTQTMVKAAQKIIYDIRRDLFHTMEKLPLKYFDQHPDGDTMSRFTNDVDTVSDALNNSFAMVIQSFYPSDGNSGLAFYPELAAESAGHPGIWCHVSLYPLQRKEKHLLLQSAAAVSGRAQRLHRGDDTGAESGKSIQSRIP